jgi:hypothetical protein
MAEFRSRRQEGHGGRPAGSGYRGDNASLLSFAVPLAVAVASFLPARPPGPRAEFDTHPAPDRTQEVTAEENADSSHNGSGPLQAWIRWRTRCHGQDSEGRDKKSQC